MKSRANFGDLISKDNYFKINGGPIQRVTDNIFIFSFYIEKRKWMIEMCAEYTTKDDNRRNYKIVRLL
jgi:hypothetical protein